MRKTKLSTWLAITVLAAAYFSELYTVYTLNPHPCEDAYITFRFSCNWADGHGPVFNPGEAVEGYSNFLWMGALALAVAAGLDPALASQAAGALFNTLALLLVWYIPRRHFCIRGPSLFLAPLLYLLFLPFHFSATTGLETSLYMFLILLGLHALLSAGRRALPLSVAAAVFLLIALTRPEGVVYFAFAGACLAGHSLHKKESLLPYFPGLMLFLAGYSAFILWRLSYYGLPLPNTYYAKGAFPFLVRTAIGAAVNKSFLMHYFYLFILIVASLGFVEFPIRKRLSVIIAMIAAGFFFSIGFSGFDWMPFFRYTLPVVPLLIILCQVLFSNFWSPGHTRAQRLVRAGITAVIMFMACEQFVTDLTFNLRWKQLDDFAYHNQQALGSWIRRELGREPLIAIGDVGRLAFISEARILDIFGLASREFAALKKDYCTPDIDYGKLSVSFDSYKEKERRLLMKFAPDYVFLYNARLKISDTFPGSAAGIGNSPDFLEHYDYMSRVYIIPRVASPSWPRLHHFIDVLDLSAGLLSWIRDGWGYDIYIRKDSPHKRFTFELAPDERIINIVDIRQGLIQSLGGDKSDGDL